jgi:hypothetical protein
MAKYGKMLQPPAAVQAVGKPSRNPSSLFRWALAATDRLHVHPSTQVYAAASAAPAEPQPAGVAGCYATSAPRCAAASIRHCCVLQGDTCFARAPGLLPPDLFVQAAHGG